MSGSYFTGSGSVKIDTSVDSEFYRDSSGITDENQKFVLRNLESLGSKGATALELSIVNWSVTKARISTALTNLHISDKIERLSERRGHHYVYVLRKFIHGREVRPYTPQSYHLHTEEAILRAEALSLYLHDRSIDPDPNRRDPLSGDKEVARALDYIIAVSRRNQISRARANPETRR